jgi:signal transduction histidine kinase
VAIPERERQDQLLAAERRELEHLLHVISHDLREPLRAIESFSQLLAARHADQLDATGRDFVRRVSRAASRMRQLLDDLQELSRAGRCACDGEIVDAREVVDRALERLAQRIDETGARVRIAPALGELHANRTWAIQALHHLLSNALKFTREGLVPEIEIEPWAGGDGTAGLAVLDRGPGVPPEHRERIFVMFQRAVGHEIEGTGAGLAVVRTVATRHGGRAWVEPRPAGGTKFVVSFEPHRPNSGSRETEHATSVDRDRPGGGQ